MVVPGVTYCDSGGENLGLRLLRGPSVDALSDVWGEPNVGPGQSSLGDSVLRVNHVRSASRLASRGRPVFREDIGGEAAALLYVDALLTCPNANRSGINAAGTPAGTTA